MTVRRLLGGRWQAALINLAIVVGLLGAANFLPQDNSLRDRRAAGVLKLCVPATFPPLVTGDAQMPGYDIDLAKAMAERMGLRLTVNTVPSIGRDFNPRNWNLTRAQCDVIGGGIADTIQSRGFLQLLPTGLEIGWLMIAPDGALPPSGATVAVLPGTSGLDRLALSAWLRDHGYRPRPVRSTSELADMLARGEATAAIGESLTIAPLLARLDGEKALWPEGENISPRPLAFGTWKGDVTLKRAMQSALADLEQSGVAEALRTRYGQTDVAASPS